MKLLTSLKRRRGIIGPAAITLLYLLFPVLFCGQDADPSTRVRPAPFTKPELSFGYASSVPDQLDITWQYPEPEKPVEFIIERAKDEPERFETIAKVDFDPSHPGVQSYRDTGLAPETRYFYRVSSCGENNCAVSEIKDIKTAPPPSPAPSDLKAEAVSAHEVRLSWKDRSEHEIGFAIERKEGKYFHVVGKVDANRTTFNDCRLIPGETYTYRVKALDQHRSSDENPVITVSTPDLERVGRLIPAPEIDDCCGGVSMVFGRNNWGTAWASQKDNLDGRYPESEYTELYFALLGPGGEASEPAVRVSRAPGESSGPTLAWTGSEFGLAWSDSRFARTFDCDGAEDCDMHREVFFHRLSEKGRPLGPELRITDRRYYVFYPRLFWRDDHYDLMFLGNGAIYFLPLTPQGKKSGEPRLIAPAISFSRPFDAAPAGEEYGLCWVDRQESNNRLYFMAFNPIRKRSSPPILLSGDQDDPVSCSIAWTGSAYGVFWENHQCQIVLSLITGPGDEPAHDKMALNVLTPSCPQDDDTPHPGKIPYCHISPQATWNGSEFGLVAGRLGRGKKLVLGFVRLAPDGAMTSPEQNLGPPDWDNIYPVPKPVWNGTDYYIAVKHSVLIFK